MIHARTGFLFHAGGRLYDWLDRRISALKSKVDALDEDYILTISESDLCAELLAEYTVDRPLLIEESTKALPPTQIEVDVSKDPMRHRLHNGDQRTLAKATRFTFCVPYHGNRDVFDLKPDRSYTGTGPRGEFHAGEIRFVYDQFEADKEKLNGDFARDIGLVKEYLGFGADQLHSFNQSLSNQIEMLVRSRKQRLLDARDILAHIGVPIRERTDVPKVFSPPVVRRKIRTAPSVQASARFQPEPGLDEDVYKDILKMIQDMVLVMEKSKKTFAQMKEEDLRNILLVVLNAHFEGGATGETFNSEGKTDILVNVKGKNVFIAECKFWTGPKSLTKAVDQLLGYLCWRDTKTAIILFNRRKDFTSVLEKIPGAVQSHAMHKKPLGMVGETTFRYLFRHKDDSDRELLLTVLAFEIPK